MTASPDPIERLRAALAGQYDVERLLGQGGMGAVYLATDQRLDRPVAIKVVAAEVASSPVLRERFLQEARVVARLRHPNIVAVYTAGDVDGQLYFAMELVQGESLKELLQREGRLPPERAQQILHELALALDYAHSQGVVHRDVKPENILLDRDTGRAMLTDFGVARALERDGSLTGTGVVLGSPRYMSPEQATGERTLDGRSDLYALALVGYEMITGKPVVDASSSAAMLVKHLTETPIPLAEAAPGTPPGVATAIDRALNKVPDERWANGREMADVIGGVTPASGTRATRAAMPAPAALKARGKWPQVVAAVGLLAVATVAGLWWRGRDFGSRQAFVVVPFEIQSGNRDVAWLREGAVNMLTMSLAQWSDLQVTNYERTLDLVQAEGVAEGARVSLEAARGVARRAGARSLVMGQVSTTTDSLIVVARLYDASNGRLLNDATHTIGIAADPRPTFDALARNLLELTGGAVPGNTVELVNATTSSLTAYRDYLDGLRALHGWDLDRADTLFAQAIARDSNFALAYHKRALTRGWNDVGGTIGLESARQALAKSTGLPPDQKALIQGHWYLANGLSLQQRGDSTAHGQLVAAIREYEQLVQADSLLVEAWYGLGDSKYHYLNQATLEETPPIATGAIRAFDRTLDLDPSFHLGYSHLIAQYVTLASLGNRTTLRGDSVVLVADVPAGMVAAYRDSATARAVTIAREWVAADPESERPYQQLVAALQRAGKPDSAAVVARSGAERTGDRGTQLRFLATLADFQAGSATLAGALDSAMRLVSPRVAERANMAERAQVGGLTMGLAAAAGDSRLLERAAAFWSGLDSTLYIPEVALAPHVDFARRVLPIAMGDTVTPAMLRDLKATAAAIDRDETGVRRFQSSSAAYLLFVATKDTVFGAYAQKWAGGRMIELDAARALAVGDTARARTIAADFPSPDSVRGSNLGMAGLRTATRAEVMEQLGDLRTAVGNYESLDPLRFNMNTTIEPGLAVYVRSFAARGRLYEQLGERDKARAAYETFLARWPVDDPITARERASVRAALARLLDTPR